MAGKKVLNIGPFFGKRRSKAKETRLEREMAADGGACIICLDTSPPPIQSGCACRGDSGLAHIACLVRAAASQQAQRGSDGWRKCQTCKQDYTGAMQTGLAEAWRDLAGRGSGGRPGQRGPSNLNANGVRVAHWQAPMAEGRVSESRQPRPALESQACWLEARF